MRKTIYIILLCTLVLIFSCEKGGLLVICNDCLLVEPEKATIEVRMSTYNPASGLFSVNIKIYDGNLEDSILIDSDNVTGGEWTYIAFFNKKYTFTATYVTANNTYITIGDAFPKVRFVKDQCEEPCYLVYGNKVNLRLKYPKI